MEHSAVARIYDAGTTDRGQPWFAMEHVKGIPITTYCDQNELSIEQRLGLFRIVCSGIQHAHLRGVMHRDIKPSNVLVTVQDGEPSAKIIDFGLAKAVDHRLVEATLFTEQGQVIGTPEYMSPEQAGLGGLDVDTRTDIYSLGVLLYELLTGMLPFERSELLRGGFAEMQRIIRETEPKKPSTRITPFAERTTVLAKHRRLTGSELRRRLRGDLDWVVLKALEKDRTRRYRTAAELADDLERHARHESVVASPPSAYYRLRKLVRRHPMHMLVALLLVALAGATATYLLWRDAEHAKELAVASEQQLSRKVRDYGLISGVVLFERAVAREAALYPPWPSQIEAMQRWLHDDAGRLLSMRPLIEQTVRELEAREAAPGTPHGTAVEDEASRFLHDTLRDLLARVDSLTNNEVPAVQQRLEWARRIDDLSRHHPNARVTWDAVRRAVKASELYSGQNIELRDDQVTGLVPIGMNPVTKLFEFYELRSAWDGKVDPRDIPVPQHDAKGRIDVSDDTGIVFVLLPGGTFTMGAQNGSGDRPRNEELVRQRSESGLVGDDAAPCAVTLAPFLLARHEMTQGQWLRLWDGDRALRYPSKYKPGEEAELGGRMSLAEPVEQVDWNHCVQLLAHHGLQLPTEAQWEYACRATTRTTWWAGEQEQDLAGKANLLDPRIWTGPARHSRVGSFEANPFGLHDMHGNVREWCRDVYSTAQVFAPGDGLRLPAQPSTKRVTRGGSFRDPAWNARSAHRDRDDESIRISIIGFRAARALSQ
jgi:formylglycine-generating enzyme required for sulfatase activity